MRSTDVGIQLVAEVGGYTMTCYLDGNANGVRKADILDGTDPIAGTTERLAERFRGVDFGLPPGLPPVDPGTSAPAGDPIKFGSTDIVTFTPFGSSSSGSLFLAGPGGGVAIVRLYGLTGKVRALEFDRSSSTWKPL